MAYLPLLWQDVPMGWRAACWGALGLVALSGCSKTYEADFVNPCRFPITISTHYAGGEDSLIQRAVLPAETLTTVEDALQDAAGFEWKIRIKGSERELTLDSETDGRWLVVIPAAVCDEVENSQDG